jgi:hypothetical protein
VHCHDWNSSVFAPGTCQRTRGNSGFKINLYFGHCMLPSHHRCVLRRSDAHARMICRFGARAPDLRLWRYALIVRAVTTCVHAHAQAREHKCRVATVTTSVGTLAVMSGLSRAPEKKKRLPARTSDLSTSGASASVFMDACKSTSSPANSSTWSVLTIVYTC